MRLLGNQRGMALLLVLVVVALLSALLTEFSFSTLVELRATETFRDRTKAFYLARGGVEAARVILLEDGNNYDHPSEFWGDPLANIPAGDGDVSLQIEDLSGRFNLNSVADRNGNPLSGYHRFIALCQEVLGSDRTEAELLATALVNWFYADLEQPTEDDSYYASQQPPYRRKGGKLDSLDELRLVRGFSPERVEKLLPFLRVQGDEPINLNAASGEVLYAWQFSDPYREIVFDFQDVAELLRYRQGTPLQSLNDLAKVEGIGERWSSAWLSGSVTVAGSLFQITSSGRVNQVSREATALIEKSGNKLVSLRVE